MHSFVSGRSPINGHSSKTLRWNVENYARSKILFRRVVFADALEFVRVSWYGVPVPYKPRPHLTPLIFWQFCFDETTSP